MTNALANTNEILMPALLKKMVNRAIVAFDDMIFNTREIIRQGRSVPRKHKTKKPFCMNYKPL